MSVIAQSGRSYEEIMQYLHGKEKMRSNVNGILFCSQVWRYHVSVSKHGVVQMSTPHP